MQDTHESISRCFTQASYDLFAFNGEANHRSRQKVCWVGMMIVIFLFIAVIEFGYRIKKTHPNLSYITMGIGTVGTLYFMGTMTFHTKNMLQRSNLCISRTSTQQESSLLSNAQEGNTSIISNNRSTNHQNDHSRALIQYSQQDTFCTMSYLANYNISNAVASPPSYAEAMQSMDCLNARSSFINQQSQQGLIPILPTMLRFIPRDISDRFCSIPNPPPHLPSYSIYNTISHPVSYADIKETTV